MDKEQFQKAMMMYNTGAISLPEFTEFCMTYIKELEQNITDPKMCGGCQYHAEVDEDGWGVCSNVASWLYLEETPLHAMCTQYGPKTDR